MTACREIDLDLWKTLGFDKIWDQEDFFKLSTSLNNLKDEYECYLADRPDDANDRNPFFYESSNSSSETEDTERLTEIPSISSAQNQIILETKESSRKADWFHQKVCDLADLFCYCFCHKKNQRVFIKKPKRKRQNPTTKKQKLYLKQPLPKVRSIKKTMTKTTPRSTAKPNPDLDNSNPPCIVEDKIYPEQNIQLKMYCKDATATLTGSSAIQDYIQDVDLKEEASAAFEISGEKADPLQAAHKTPIENSKPILTLVFFPVEWLQVETIQCYMSIVWPANFLAIIQSYQQGHKAAFIERLPAFKRPSGYQTKMIKRLHTMKIKTIPTPADGNCFLHATKQAYTKTHLSKKDHQPLSFCTRAEIIEYRKDLSEKLNSDLHPRLCDDPTCNHYKTDKDEVAQKELAHSITCKSMALLASGLNEKGYHHDIESLILVTYCTNTNILLIAPANIKDSGNTMCFLPYMHNRIIDDIIVAIITPDLDILMEGDKQWGIAIKQAVPVIHTGDSYHYVTGWFDNDDDDDDDDEQE